MNMILQPNRWSCGLASLSMISEISIEALIEVIGHDGSEIIFPDMPEPWCRKSFSTQNFIDALRPFSMSLVPILGYPVIEGPESEVPVYQNSEARLLNYMREANGLVEGMMSLNHPHIWAYDGEKLYDPTDGKITSLDDTAISISIFWMLVHI